MLNLLKVLPSILAQTLDPRVDKLFGFDVPRTIQEAVWTVAVFAVSVYCF